MYCILYSTFYLFTLADCVGRSVRKDTETTPIYLSPMTKEPFHNESYTYAFAVYFILRFWTKCHFLFQTNHASWSDFQQKHENFWVFKNSTPSLDPSSAYSKSNGAGVQLKCDGTR